MNVDSNERRTQEQAEERLIEVDAGAPGDGPAIVRPQSLSQALLAQVERAGEAEADPATPPHPLGARRNGGPETSEQASRRQPQLNALLAELDEARTRSEQLEHALRSRIVIEQAKGVLAERFGWNIETAFEVLRSAARSTRMNIHQLAHDVVAGESTPKPITSAIARGQHRSRTTR